MDANNPLNRRILCQKKENNKDRRESQKKGKNLSAKLLIVQSNSQDVKRNLESKDLSAKIVQTASKDNAMGAPF